MLKRVIKISFQNGLSFQGFKEQVFDINGVSDVFEFQESASPDFVIFGPYGNDIPPIGNYMRVGYFCENIRPDMAICEWAFGIPTETEINDNRYKRIQWHGTNPESLIKRDNYNAKNILKQKTNFCNFLYSHKVPYREAFFRRLSQYKKVDAPGKSMTNMKSIDELYNGDMWQRKKQFLSTYKFTIAFENDVFPGYQTEKLYDAMQANSIPVYCGDPDITATFNPRAFINTADYMSKPDKLGNWLQKHSQMDFNDIRPQYYKNPIHRLKRKVKTIGREWKMSQMFNNIGFDALINKIIELDNNDDKYIEMLNQPWFNNNTLPINSRSKDRWVQIFNTRHGS